MKLSYYSHFLHYLFSLGLLHASSMNIDSYSPPQKFNPVNTSLPIAGFVPNDSSVAVTFARAIDRN